MKFEVVLEELYPQSIDKVWEGLTSRGAISSWLMETHDFSAEVGHRFEMFCVDDAGHRDVYRCEVLELDPPHRMRWSWVLAGNEKLGVTEVEFRLSTEGSGTRLTLYHRGDRDREMLERFKQGWPDKLADLGDVLKQPAKAATSTRSGAQ